MCIMVPWQDPLPYMEGINMNWKFWKRRQTNPQDWKPHWTIGILYGIWRIAFAAFKIALGAAATVVLIGLICCFVFVNMLGVYL